MRRECKPDYLAYRLLDEVIDGYFPVLEAYGDLLEELDNALVAESSPALLSQIHRVRTGLLLLRRSVWPHREAISELMHASHEHISDTTRLYLRDCYDHCVHILDLMETYRELASDLRDFYLTTVSNRMNEVMKVLTIIATIFIPLSFIAGLYGMNFNPKRSRWNMPELDWPLGYPFALALMVIVAAAMLLFFRRRGWIGKHASQHDS